MLTAKLTLIVKSECSDDADAATDEEAERFLEADADEEKKMETDAAEDADNLVCYTCPDAVLLFIVELYRCLNCDIV